MKAGRKAAIQGFFGRMPGGERAYRFITRHLMGTQSTHIDKLSRSWAEHGPHWMEMGALNQGSVIWVHGGGWTIYPSLLSYLLTGKGGILTSWEGPPSEKYTAKSLEYALKQTFPGFEVPKDRIELLSSLSGRGSGDVLDAIGAKAVRAGRVRVGLPDASADLLVTGGILEHYRPEELRQFLAESRRALAPGGWCSHVFDMRDHLYHSDKSIPFLDHLRLSPAAYERAYGHPLGSHNRLLPAQIENIFQEAGFDICLTRRRTLPANRWAQDASDFETALLGLERRRLAPEFASATEEDLRTVALHILARKLE